MGVLALWVWQSYGCGSHMGVVVIWVWQSCGCGSHVGVLVMWGCPSIAGLGSMEQGSMKAGLQRYGLMGALSGLEHATLTCGRGGVCGSVSLGSSAVETAASVCNGPHCCCGMGPLPPSRSWMMALTSGPWMSLSWAKLQGDGQ